MNKLNNKKKCDRVSAHSHSKLKQRLISILILLIVLLSLPLSVARAGTWWVMSSGLCGTGNPSGKSELYWGNYPPGSWGKSWGWLWYYTGGRWTLKSSGYDDAEGASEYAIACTVAIHEDGSWTQTGAHQASFFSGTVNSYGNVFTCQ